MATTSRHNRRRKASGTHLLSIGVQTIISLACLTLDTLRAALPARDRPLKALTGAAGAFVTAQEDMLSRVLKDGAQLVCLREEREGDFR
jgi:hypothetical protein